MISNNDDVHLTVSPDFVNFVVCGSGIVSVYICTICICLLGWVIGWVLKGLQFTDLGFNNMVDRMMEDCGSYISYKSNVVRL